MFTIRSFLGTVCVGLFIYFFLKLATLSCFFVCLVTSLGLETGLLNLIIWQLWTSYSSHCLWHADFSFSFVFLLLFSDAVGCLCAECSPKVYTEVLLCVPGLGLPPDTCTDSWFPIQVSLTLQCVCACMCVCSTALVVSNSLWLYGLEATRLLFPRDSPSNNTGVGCHALLQGIFPTQGSNLWFLLCW